MTKLTKAMRKAIRDAGPFALRGSMLCHDGVRSGGAWLTTRETVAALTALNAIASEPEAVAAAREALLRAARLYDDASILKAAQRLRVAIREAKRATLAARDAEVARLRECLRKTAQCLQEAEEVILSGELVDVDEDEPGFEDVVKEARALLDAIDPARKAGA